MATFEKRSETQRRARALSHTRGHVTGQPPTDLLSLKRWARKTSGSTIVDPLPFRPCLQSLRVLSTAANPPPLFALTRLMFTSRSTFPGEFVTRKRFRDLFLEQKTFF